MHCIRSLPVVAYLHVFEESNIAGLWLFPSKTHIYSTCETLSGRRHRRNFKIIKKINDGIIKQFKFNGRF